MFIAGGCSFLFPDTDLEKIYALKFFNPYLKRQIIISEVQGKNCFLVKHYSSASSDWKLCSGDLGVLVGCFKLLEDLQKKIARQKELWRWELYKPPFIVEVGYLRSGSSYRTREITINNCKKRVIYESLVSSTF